ncbi:threonine dehydratase [Paraburkholderia sp. BL6669N2]|uniref:threonine ammonia-lyase n=1 Tax=Paraburkholderia sp. BL6669N2 TaxID=1938807 RepID=UPI000E24A94E|nr:pyridoxal-phosphate dependent enzyme [Paraburkholderia sp. BL6669N2]REG59196.1 threonine dehydratase [Paraburkholderia sp. BL6669N2]
MRFPGILHHARASFGNGVGSGYLGEVSRADIERASETIRGTVVRTPLLPYAAATDRSVFLKPENLQPRGSFKIRCALNAVSSLTAAQLTNGVYTASTGNFALGVTEATRVRGADVRVYVTDTAARSKIEALRSLGAEVIKVPYERWWAILCGEIPPGETGTFLHPCACRDVIVGDASIGQEILEDLPDVDVILVPFGGGGLIMGTALACAHWDSRAKLYACESEAAAPFYSSLAAGAIVEVPVDSTPMIAGIGVSTVLDANWPYLNALVDGVIVSTLEDTAEAIRCLAKHNHLVVEGAGAVALAAALHPYFAGKRIAAVLTGGGIDMHVLASVLAGDRSAYLMPSQLRNYE